MPYSKLAEYYYQSYSNHHVQCCTLHIFIICCLLSVLPFLFFSLSFNVKYCGKPFYMGFFELIKPQKNIRCVRKYKERNTEERRTQVQLIAV